MNDMKITIAGGGIAGLTAGAALLKTGHKVTILEQAPEIRAAGAGLALAANAMHALDCIGIADVVRREGNELDFFSIRNRKGRLISRNDSRKGIPYSRGNNFTIDRGALQGVLKQVNTGNEIITGKRLQRLNEHPNGITLWFDDGTFMETDVLIAADGIHSVVRRHLFPEEKYPLRYSGYTCWRAIVHCPDLRLSESSETWGANGRFGIVPLAGGKVYWFATANARENDLQMRRTTPADLQQRFENYHTPIPELIKRTSNDQLLWNDISDLTPLPQFHHGRIVLIGDAAHATTPNMGQGACQAMEDAYVLSEELQRNPTPEQAFEAFSRRRLERTHQIVRTSRKLGALAQSAHPLMMAVRNTLFRMIPENVRIKQLAKVLTTDF